MNTQKRRPTQADLNLKYGELCMRLGALEAQKRKIQSEIDSLHFDIRNLDAYAGALKEADKGPKEGPTDGKN